MESNIDDMVVGCFDLVRLILLTKPLQSEGGIPARLHETEAV